jgi:MFS-type transporter involved in bile tolerance (Atg22 family)
MTTEKELNEKPVKAVKPKFIFDKQNYMIMAAAVVVIIIGFIIMSGSTDIYSTTKITVAPIIVLLGFGLGIYAIMKKPSGTPEA